MSQAYIYLREHITYLDYDFAEDEEYASLFLNAIADHDIVVSHHHGYYALGRSASAALMGSEYPVQWRENEVPRRTTVSG